MTEKILCPTRGGKASYPNQDWAVALAKERQAELIFLYVSNVRYLGLTARPVVVDIETELDEMGDFILTMAQERAEKAGVSAQIAVERGVFREVLKEVIREQNIAIVVLGSSTESTGVTTIDYIRELGKELSLETGVEFIILQDGKVLDVIQP